MLSESPRLLVFGLGYAGLAVARLAVAAGMRVAGTVRAPSSGATDGVDRLPFDAAAPALASATHVLATAPPEAAGDPVLAHYGTVLADAPALCWIGYLSTTGVYGDRAGGCVDETTAPAPASARSRARLAAEDAWRRLADRRAVDIVRLAGIYGPDRSALDQVRAGGARRIAKPGHLFGRIHRDDIAGGVLAAMRQARPPGARVLNFSDDEPAEQASVLAEAARLLGAPPPPQVPFAAAFADMSPMARSFWAEDRKVSSAATQAALGYRWRYPSYREGLRAIMIEQAGDHGA